MKWVFIIIALASAVFAGAMGSDVLTNRRTNDDGLVHTADEILHSNEEDSSIHRLLQQDSQMQRNQNQSRNPNRDRNRQPNRQQNGGRNRDRNRHSGGVCTPFGSQCDPTQSNCCQGGCNMSTHQCFCQDNGGLCFNKGGEDNFCCSNRCGDDGLCSCIAMGESCDVGGAFCCGGLTCSNDGQCIQGTNTAVATEQPTPLPIPRPSLEPTVLPTPRPTLMPTPEPTEQPTPLPTLRPSPKPTTEQPTPLPTPHPSPDQQLSVLHHVHRQNQLLCLHYSHRRDLLLILHNVQLQYQLPNLLVNAEDMVVLAMDSITCAARVYVEKMRLVKIDATELEIIALECMNLVARDCVVKMECVLE